MKGGAQMKIITIPDLHGRTCWQEINPNEYDLMVFLGDYTDSYTESNLDIKSNLLSVISLKKHHYDKVVLLLGNHELFYWFLNTRFRCSGNRNEIMHDFYQIFKENRELFKVAHQIKNYLWTHAGVHHGWYQYEFPFSSYNVADDINDAFRQNVDSLFHVGMRRGGFKDVGGPFWLDKYHLSKKPLPNYHQIVGHTPVKKITTIDYHNASVTFCDCLMYEEEYYVLKIDDNEQTEKKKKKK